MTGKRFETVDVVDLVEANLTSIGLAFVPEVLAGATDATRAKASLIRAARMGLIELRPDAGLGRYTQAELDAAPDGPQGSKLMWARLL